MQLQLLSLSQCGLPFDMAVVAAYNTHFAHEVCHKPVRGDSVQHTRALSCPSLPSHQPIVSQYYPRYGM